MAGWVRRQKILVLLLLIGVGVLVWLRATRTVGDPRFVGTWSYATYQRGFFSSEPQQQQLVLLVDGTWTGDFDPFQESFLSYSKVKGDRLWRVKNDTLELTIGQRSESIFEDLRVRITDLILRRNSAGWNCGRFRLEPTTDGGRELAEFKNGLPPLKLIVGGGQRVVEIPEEDASDPADQPDESKASDSDLEAPPEAPDAESPGIVVEFQQLRLVRWDPINNRPLKNARSD